MNDWAAILPSIDQLVRIKVSKYIHVWNRVLEHYLVAFNPFFNTVITGVQWKERKLSRNMLWICGATSTLWEILQGHKIAHTGKTPFVFVFRQKQLAGNYGPEVHAVMKHLHENVQGIKFQTSNQRCRLGDKHRIYKKWTSSSMYVQTVFIIKGFIKL